MGFDGGAAGSGRGGRGDGEEVAVRHGVVSPRPSPSSFELPRLSPIAPTPPTDAHVQALSQPARDRRPRVKAEPLRLVPRPQGLDGIDFHERVPLPLERLYTRVFEPVWCLDDRAAIHDFSMRMWPCRRRRAARAAEPAYARN